MERFPGSLLMKQRESRRSNALCADCLGREDRTHRCVWRKTLSREARTLRDLLPGGEEVAGQWGEDWAFGERIFHVTQLLNQLMSEDQGLPWASLVVQMVKNSPATQETQVQSLGREDPLEEEVATHSRILAWRIPWTEEPRGLQSTGSQTVGHDWATDTFTFRDFPGGPVVKTPRFQCRGCGFIHWSGN